MKYNSLRLAIVAFVLGLSAAYVTSCSNDDDPVPQPADTHEAVDLGLPSGTKWAATNIGSSKESEIGLYFAWGEVVGYGSDPKDGRPFLLGDYKWGDESLGMFGITKYQIPDGYDGSDENHPKCSWYDDNGNFIGDGKAQLDPEDDAAATLWGNGWRMPTKADVEELVANCTYEWTTLEGTEGAKLTSKINGKSIFLPACGDRGNGDIHWVGVEGYYWASTVATATNALADMIYFSSEKNLPAFAHYARRFGGRNIRPVRK